VKEGRKDVKEGRKEGRKEGKEGRKERKEGRIDRAIDWTIALIEGVIENDLSPLLIPM
jgi:hypothetical protein